MSTTVEITIGDDGKISVGLTDSPSSEAEDMQPAKSLGDALAIARHILSNPQAAQQEEAAEGPDADDSGLPTTGQAASSGTPDGTGGGTGPDSSGSVVSDDTQASGVGDSSGAGGGQDAKAIWDALANMNLPQH